MSERKSLRISYPDSFGDTVSKCGLWAKLKSIPGLEGGLERFEYDGEVKKLRGQIRISEGADVAVLISSARRQINELLPKIAEVFSVDTSE